MKAFSWVLVFLLAEGAILGSASSAEEATGSSVRIEKNVADDSDKIAVIEDWEKKLESTPVLVDFNETELQDVAAYFSNLLATDVILNHRDLDEVGISKETPITFAVTQNKISARLALDLVLEPHGLTWYYREGVIVITNTDIAEKDENMVTRVYKVADLLPKPAKQNDPSASQPTPTPAEKKDSDQQPEKSILKEEPANSTAAKAPSLPEEQTVSATDTLHNIIEQTVLPYSWGEVGGPASMETYGDVLIVRQTIEGHRKLRELLSALRAAKPDLSTYPPQTKVWAGGGGTFCGGYQKASDLPMLSTDK